MIHRAQIEGVPSEELLRRLLDEAREVGADEIVVPTAAAVSLSGRVLTADGRRIEKSVFVPPYGLVVLHAR